MKNKIDTVYTKKNITIILAIIVVLMILGSLFDYSLSLSLFNESNLFGRILAAYGQLPVSLGMLISGTLLIYVCEKRFCLSTVLSFLFGILLALFGLFMSAYEPVMYLSGTLSTPVLVCITLILMFCLDLVVFRLVKDGEKDQIKQLIKYMVFATLMTTVVINVIKIPWGRPRMRMIAVTPEASFQPWWVVGSEMKDRLMAMGVASEEFKSFPSGHTASAACMLMIAAFPVANETLKKHEQTLFWIAVIFAFVVGFSRIIMGAHFLTDITAGFTVGFFVNAIGYHLFITKETNQ